MPKLAFIILLVMPAIPRTTAIQDVSDPHRGGVSGVVLDELGHAAPGISVAMAGRLPRTVTDGQGQSELRGLLAGPTLLTTEKYGSFYPSAWSTFWDGEGTANAVVPEGGFLNDVHPKLTPVARLTVHVVDAVSALAIGSFHVANGAKGR